MKTSLAGSSLLTPAFIHANSSLKSNLIIIRFGGGVRRKETIHPKYTYSPYFCKELLKKGTLFSNMNIKKAENIETSHEQGTLRILTGNYQEKSGDEGGVFDSHYQADTPTLFEIYRKKYKLKESQCLMINHEDRLQEEFYTFSKNENYGLPFKGHVLSLHRFKIFLLRKKILAGKSNQIENMKLKLNKLLKFSDTINHKISFPPEINHLWEQWLALYGDTGLRNARGDRLLTDLSLFSMELLKPKFIMINYNDPDYVHWGNPTHYTRAISIIDQGIKQIYQYCQNSPFYKNNTHIAIIPDCGRDNTRTMSVPFQHHFGSKSSREIFAFFMGPKVTKNKIIQEASDQIDFAPTIAKLQGIQDTSFEGKAWDL